MAELRIRESSQTKDAKLCEYRAEYEKVRDKFFSHKMQSQLYEEYMYRIEEAIKFLERQDDDYEYIEE